LKIESTNGSPVWVSAFNILKQAAIVLTINNKMIKSTILFLHIEFQPFLGTKPEPQT